MQNAHTAQAWEVMLAVRQKAAEEAKAAAISALLEGKSSMTGGLVQEASHQLLPSVTPAVCAVLQLLAMVPVLVKLWRRPEAGLPWP